MMKAEIKDLIISIEDLFELIDRNDLVRNIDHDDDTKYFRHQGLRITKTLLNLQNNVGKVKKLMNDDEGNITNQ